MRWIKALGALAVLALLVVGVPLGLIAFVGNPWPDGGVDLQQELSDEAIIGALAAVAWLLWAQLLVCIVVETVAAVRNGVVDARVPGAFGFQQQLARVLITSVVLAIGSSTMISLHTEPASAATFTPATTTNTITPAITTPAAVDVDQVAADIEDSGSTITVQHGDTLWGLAEKHLGDGAKFEEISQLNEGRTMPDGKVFRTSDRLEAGWELRMPAGATGLNEAAQAQNTEVQVEAGDSLWKIAEEQYGEGSEWPKIWKANKGEQFEDGRTFTDPDLIQPGWDLDVPGTTAAAHTEQFPKPAAPNTGADRSAADSAGKPSTAEPQPADAHDESATSHSDSRADLPSISPRAVEGGIQPQTTPDATSNPSESVEVSTADENDDPLPGWIMPGLMGAGTLLAGSLLLALRNRRANQHRTRRPGRTIPVTDPQLAVVEKSITVAGATTTTTVELVETLLRRLVASLTERSQPLPALAAVEVTTTAVAIHLRKPATPPGEPWVVSDDGLLWVVDKEVDPDLVGAEQVDSPAPWPLLVTIGQDDQGGSWLLNIEDLSVVVTGDSVAVGDFARFVAAEVACNPWSKHTVLDVVGIAREVAVMSPERIHAHDTPTAVATQAVADAVHTIDRLAEHNVDTPTARALQTDPDPWPSRLLIVDHPDMVDELDQLVRLVTDHSGRTATAVMLLGQDHAESFEIHIDERRQLTIPAVNLTVQAVGLTAAEAHGCAALLAHADADTDEAAPDLAGDQTWQSMATATGSLRDQYRFSRATSTLEPSGSLLEDADHAYTSVAATTSEDLEALAPKVTETVREEVAAADPTLDTDLDDWTSEDCVRPRLTLLGPVGARTSGNALDRRKPFYTELFAYLATRPYGATTDEVAAAFDINASRVRTDVNKLRDWLGVNPETGEKFIPDARNAPSAQQRGIGVYEVVNALVDTDLFRRLRVRGESRGPNGIDDLVRALQLVTGRPFEKLRPGGWGWLLEGDRLDQHMVCAIADVAHVVVTHSLHAGDLDRARTAAGIAVMAAPDEEVARLDLAAVLEAQGHEHEAERIVREDVANRSDDGEAPTELPARTEQIIDARRWLHRTAM